MTLAVAGDSRLPDELRGLLNDYTPASVSGGPYEMRGEWSLDLHGASGTATFAAAMNMETSDWGISKGIVDPEIPASRSPHTHHITVANGAVSRDTSLCPTFNPATSGGFMVTGTADVTGNGSPAPFQTGGRPPSTVQICISGGATVALSNFTLTFTGPATGHFGMQAIRGVVTCTRPSPDRRRSLCDDDAPRGWGAWFYGDEASHAH